MKECLLRTTNLAVYFFSIKQPPSDSGYSLMHLFHKSQTFSMFSVFWKRFQSYLILNNTNDV